MTKEYIERTKLLADYDRQHTGEPGRARKLIEEATAADVVEVRHELWVHDYNNLYGCTGCGERETMSRKNMKRFCPNCGARMDGGT